MTRFHVGLTLNTVHRGFARVSSTLFIVSRRCMYGRFPPCSPFHLARRTCAGVAGIVSDKSARDGHDGDVQVRGEHVYAIKAKSYVRAMFRGDVIKKGDPDKSGRGISAYRGRAVASGRSRRGLARRSRCCWCWDRVPRGMSYQSAPIPLLRRPYSLRPPPPPPPPPSSLHGRVISVIILRHLDDSSRAPGIPKHFIFKSLRVRFHFRRTLWGPPYCAPRGIVMIADNDSSRELRDWKK